MGIFGGFMTRLRAAGTAFRKPDLISDPLKVDANWKDIASRINRYDISWSFYENSQYDETVEDSARKSTYKKAFGLYRYTRNIYNPSYRLGEFWKTHLWGGSLLDLPILPTDENNEALLVAIALIFQWSNWPVNKDVATLYGSVLGDVGLKIVEDEVRRKIHLSVVHPGTIAEIDLDPFGNVKGYVIEEEREDPLTNNDTPVIYTEIVMKQGKDILFKTLKDNQPFGWSGNPIENGEPVAVWSRPYGFVPLVMIQHNNVGLDWGFSEIHPGQSKFREVDDQGSLLNDQIRKTINTIWFFSGVTDGTLTFSESSLTGTAAANKPQPGREETPTATASSPDAKATPLVAPLDIQHTSENIQKLLGEIEKDYPEINESIVSPKNIKSGRELRLLRQPVTAKVKQRRVSYDQGLVRALQMAVAIGGELGLIDGSFDLNSFEAGDIDFAIGDRPVFAVDPLDDLEITQAKAMATQTLTNAGANIIEAARVAGFTEEEVEALNMADFASEVER